MDTPNLIALIGVIVNALVFLAAAFYTYLTRSMQQSIARQAADLSRQIRLSIMPAFMIRFEPDIFELHNIGNGTAVNIKIGQIDIIERVSEESRAEYNAEILAELDHHMGILNRSVTFRTIPTLTADAKVAVKSVTRFVETGEEPRGSIFDGLLHLRVQHKEGKITPISISFQDIEANKYEQIIEIGHESIIPGPVRLV